MKKVQRAGVKSRKSCNHRGPFGFAQGRHRGPQGKTARVGRRTESHLGRGLLPDAERATIGGYVPIVLFEAASEAVVPVAIADEVKEL